ncbi:MAG: DegT/DnrJ/EryC1/StrS family aminotransferase [Cyclobacteriaceae bacterium]
MIPFVDLKAQYLSIKNEIDEAIASVIQDTSFIGGKRVTDFEEDFAEYIGVNHCVACANGTDSMEIILKAMNIGEGDQVIVPANSWISTSEVVNNVGAEPIFVDIIESQYTIDYYHIEDAISDQTKAIIPVHLYGLPANMPQIMALANKFDLRVIEDCAQSHGAKINGRKVGSFGDAASFSFYPGKNLGAYGDAGGIVTSNQDLAERCRMIGNHGQLKKHDHRIIGRNSRMDTLQAAILKAKLPHLDSWLEARRQVAQWYDQYLKEDIIKPKTPDGMEHVFHLYVIRTKNRLELQRALDDQNIGHAIHYPTPLPLLKAYVYQGLDETDIPVSYKTSKQIISLPIFPEMSEDQVKSVARVVNEFG